MVKYKRILLLIIMLCVYTLLYYLYKIHISPMYLDMGFTFRTLDMVELIVSVLFFIMPLIFMPINMKRPSDYTVWALYLFSYTPTMLLSFHILNHDFYNILFFNMLLLGAFIIFYYSRLHSFNILPKIKINIQKIDRFMFFIIAIILVIYIWSIINYQLDLNLLTIYKRRLNTRDIIKSSSLAAYVFSFIRQCLLIFIIYLGMVRKKFYYLILVIFLALGIFSLDGTKAAILIPLVIGGLSWFLIIKSNKSVLFLPVSVFIVIFIGILEYWLNNIGYLSIYFIRRSFLVPGILNSFYWDYFSVNPNGMLTDSVLRYFIKPFYDLPLTYVIGREYLHNVKTNANTGIWMGGYAHFGILGIFVASFLGGFIVGIIDKLTKSNLYILGCVICFMIGIIWSEQMLHTSILTGGILFIIIMLLWVNISSKLRKYFSYFNKREKNN